MSKKLAIYFGNYETGVRIAGFDQDNLDRALELLSDGECLEFLLDGECDCDDLEFIDGEYFFTGAQYEEVTVIDENDNTIYKDNPEHCLSKEELDDIYEPGYDACLVENLQSVYDKCQEYNEQTGGACLILEMYDKPSFPFELELQDDEEFDICKLKLYLREDLNEEDIVVGCSYDGKELELVDGLCNYGKGSAIFKVDENGIEELEFD